MSEYIIKVENLGKKYNIKHQGERERYVALRDVIARRAQGIGSSVLGFGRHLIGLNGTANGNGSCPPSPVLGQSTTEDFWALRAVSFEVKQGEVVGIIGRNGAGKSTLLKILSRITEPTEGRVRIRGRVASLLEVGTGFHPELTGRENIFVNGAILGMTRAEVKQKFDEIVAFAEVEKFLDTPVKWYSSGMYVRLAFAIAAHLEPEILIVDEVLAVGDAEFQRKCLRKMKDVSSGSSRTVLFVSHNMDAIRRICHKGIVLRDGVLIFYGSLSESLQKYCNDVLPMPATVRHLPLGAHIASLHIDMDALLAKRLHVEIGFSSPYPIGKPTFGIVVSTADGNPVFGTNTLFDRFDRSVQNCTEGVATIVIDPLPLWSGDYTLSVWLSDELVQLDHCRDMTSFGYVGRDVPPNVPPIHILGPTRVNALWTFTSGNGYNHL